MQIQKKLHVTIEEQGSLNAWSYQANIVLLRLAGGTYHKMMPHKPNCCGIYDIKAAS